MQVWVNDRLVGHFDAKPRHNDCHIIHQMADIEDLMLGSIDDDAPATTKRISLPIRRRSAAFDSYLLDARKADMPMMLATAHIPEGATMINDVTRHQYRFTWQVFDLSPDVYEEIFDLPEFEPV